MSVLLGVRAGEGEVDGRRKRVGNWGSLRGGASRVSSKLSCSSSSTRTSARCPSAPSYNRNGTPCFTCSFSLLLLRSFPLLLPATQRIPPLHSQSFTLPSTVDAATCLEPNSKGSRCNEVVAFRVVSFRRGGEGGGEEEEKRQSCFSARRERRREGRKRKQKRTSQATHSLFPPSSEANPNSSSNVVDTASTAFFLVNPPSESFEAHAASHRRARVWYSSWTCEGEERGSQLSSGGWEGKEGGETYAESKLHTRRVKDRHCCLAGQRRSGETATVVPCFGEGANGGENDGDVGVSEFGGEEVRFSTTVAASERG